MRRPLGTGGRTADRGLKKAHRTRALLIFLDESGFSECPSVRRTWGPRRKTPVLTVPFNWERLSDTSQFDHHASRASGWPVSATSSRFDPTAADSRLLAGLEASFSRPKGEPLVGPVAGASGAERPNLSAATSFLAQRGISAVLRPRT